ncbi:MFS transporter [Bacillus sp. 349Y]|nr:MFS transporter [Bacillus sp. 349Y]
MKNKAFKALWVGEIVSELAGAAGGIINGLILYELTGSREWMGLLWLVYFLPSLVLQGMSAPFLNHVAKEKVLKRIQLLRSAAYLFPLIGYVSGMDTLVLSGLILLQLCLGLLQPIYASLSFSILPDLCREEELTEANGILDGTMRLMSFLAPGVTALLLFVVPTHLIYALSSGLFLFSALSLSRLPQTEAAEWTKGSWWHELKEGYRIFFRYPVLVRMTGLSSLVQFAVGAAMVLSIPFIRGEMGGSPWEYALFSASFPIGYVLGTWLLKKMPLYSWIMYAGLIGGGLSFALLWMAPSIPVAWGCELLGGLLFPLFNARSAAIFQQAAPRERLAQLSAVRLLMLRITMPLGILFGSNMFFTLSTRNAFLTIGLIIIVPASFFLIRSHYGEDKTGRAAA